MSELRDINTLSETASFLRKPTQTLYSWRSQGKGPRGIRLGRSVVYRREDILRWLDEQAAKTA